MGGAVGGRRGWVNVPYLRSRVADAYANNTELLSK